MSAASQVDLRSDPDRNGSPPADPDRFSDRPGSRRSSPFIIGWRRRSAWRRLAEVFEEKRPEAEKRKEPEAVGEGRHDHAGAHGRIDLEPFEGDRDGRA